MTVFEWLTDPANWAGPRGIPVEIGYHLLYTVISLAIASAIAIPLGIFIGFTGKGEAIVAGSANALRALPTLGLLVLLFLVLAPVIAGQLVFVVPTIIVLVLLAIPPILTGTYTGIQSADEAAVDAARGMGYTRTQILWRVQMPGAMPLLLSGLRGSTLQVVSTATVAAYLGLQGLGRYIIDGRAQADFAQMAGGALLVALLALTLEFVFSILGRVLVSPGLRRTTRRRRPDPTDTATAALTTLTAAAK
ncbi:ABC transporter permease [uncultured Microbacterium sp.]|uniref:ABC transporter permease n=1 Tax=uncultured Microbacterium sp. TaxID=191216 RepID=UPI0035CBF860